MKQCILFHCISVFIYFIICRYQGSFILVGSISGIVFFHEMENTPVYTHSILYKIDLLYLFIHYWYNLKHYWTCIGYSFKNKICMLYLKRNTNS